MRRRYTYKRTVQQYEYMYDAHRHVITASLDDVEKEEEEDDEDDAATTEERVSRCA